MINSSQTTIARVKRILGFVMGTGLDMVALLLVCDLSPQYHSTDLCNEWQQISLMCALIVDRQNASPMCFVGLYSSCQALACLRLSGFRSDWITGCESHLTQQFSITLAQNSPIVLPAVRALGCRGRRSARAKNASI